MTATMNGNPSRPQRKQLSEQLDRLDTILDGLGEGLNEAIADAARTATRMAVKDAVVELLINPDLRAKLHHASASHDPSVQAAPPTPTRPSMLSRLLSGAKATIAAIRQTAVRAAQGVANRIRTAGASIQAGFRLVSELTDLRLLVGLGLAVGVAAGVGTFFAPHEVAAAASGISSGIVAGAVQIGIAARRALRAVTMF
jgi:hypothetical protein